MTALRDLVPVAGGLAVALAAALACVALHTPLPWILGPLVAVAATRVAATATSGPSIHGRGVCKATQASAAASATARPPATGTRSRSAVMRVPRQTFAGKACQALHDLVRRYHRHLRAGTVRSAEDRVSMTAPGHAPNTKVPGSDHA